MLKVSNKEAALLVKCQEMLTGLDNNIELFTSLPYATKVLSVQIDLCIKLRDQFIAIIASLKEVTKNKQEGFEFLNKIFESLKYYCEGVADGNAAILAKVGLSPRAERKPTRKPGPPTSLRITREGNDSAIAEWDNPPPESGGRVTIFQVERKIEGETSFAIICVSHKRKIELKNQPVGKLLEFRIVAINTAGESIPSNVVTIKF